MFNCKIKTDFVLWDIKMNKIFYMINPMRNKDCSNSRIRHNRKMKRITINIFFQNAKIINAVKNM